MRSQESSFSCSHHEDAGKGPPGKSLCRRLIADSNWTSCSQRHSVFFLFQPLFPYALFLFRKSCRSEIKSGTWNRTKSTILIKVRWGLVLMKPAKFPVTWVEGEMRTMQVGRKTLVSPFMLSYGIVNGKMEWNGDEWIQSWELDSTPGLIKRISICNSLCV